MSMINAVIIEDEEASRLTLKNYLSKYCSQVNVVGEAENVLKGAKLIQKTNPDLVFLDIEMPYGNAFDLLENFNYIDFEIIFITAFSNYAIQAINLSSCCYLLKPLNIDQLIDAVSISQKKLEEKGSIKTSNILLENLSIEHKQLKNIALPVIDGFEIVKLKDIVYCNALDNFTQMILKDGSKKTVCRTLKFYESLLTEYNFLRVHKSYMVNLNYVERYTKGNGGDILLSNGVTVSLSASRKNAFLKKFNHF